MKRAPTHRPSRHCGLAVSVLALLLLPIASCSTTRAPSGASVTPPTSPASSQPSPQKTTPLPAGTALKTAEPAVLAKAKADREALESLVAFGSPVSLARARQMLDGVPGLRPEDRRDLAAIIDGIEALVYPDPRRKGGGSKPPRDAASAASGSAVGAAAPAAGSLFTPELKLLDSAAAGQAGPPPAEAAGTPLGELIPGLALFASDSRETARLAQDAFDRFAQLRLPSILPNLALGVDAERRLDWSEALTRYGRVLDVAPETWPAVVGTGRSLLALGRPVSALAALQPQAKALDGVPDFMRAFGRALYENGRFAEAEDPVTRVLVDDPQDSRLILIRAHLLVRDKAYQQAMPLLDAYGTVDSSNRLYLLLRCLAAEGLRSRDEALRWARRGLTLYPDDPELLVATSRLLYAGSTTGRDEARSLAAHAYELTTPGAAPGPGADSGPETDASSGAAEAKQEASPLVALARTAAGFEAARLLTIDAAARYQWSAAATYLDRAMSLGSFEDRALAAAVLRNSGNWSASLSYSEAWHRERPESEDATEAYLRALVGTGNEKTAQDMIARLLPSNASSSFRSVLYYLQSRMQKSDDAALALLRSALIENADNPEALAAMYDILARRKDWNRARFYLRQAITLDPGNPDLLRRQAELDHSASP